MMDTEGPMRIGVVETPGNTGRVLQIARSAAAVSLNDLVNSAVL